MKTNIEAERVRKQMTKGEMAKSLGITLKTYSAYINEENPIPSNILINMANMFSCSTDYLLGLTSNEKTA